MRLSEDVIRYLTVKQEGPLPTPRPSNKSSNQSEKTENENINPNNKSEPKAEKSTDNKKEAIEAPTPEIKEAVES